MPRPISLTTKNLKELQAAMRKMETAIEPKDVTPILAEALEIFHNKAVDILHSVTKRTPKLPEGWEHIEDAFKVKQGKSSTIASAFAKVFRKAAPQAIWIEWGHKQIGHKPLKKDSGKVVTAKPFFRPALDITRKDVLKRIRLRIKALLKSAAMRAGFQENGTSPDETGWIG